MTSGDISNRQFLAHVKDRAVEARNSHDTFAQAFAHAHGKRFTPMSFMDATKKVLLQIMHNDPKVANRARAADLFLMGKDRHWATEPANEREARALVAAYYERKATVPKRKQPKIKTGAKDQMNRYVAITRHCSGLTATLKNPEASAEVRLDAIQKFFAAMDYLAPEQMRALQELSQ